MDYRDLIAQNQETQRVLIEGLSPEKQDDPREAYPGCWVCNHCGCRASGPDWAPTCSKCGHFHAKATRFSRERIS